MNNCGVFITGTDTSVGKTLASAALLDAIRRRDLRAIGMKPVASGCERISNGWRNADAQMLVAHSALQADYALVNPFALPEAVAPCFAATAIGATITLPPILAAYEKLSTLAQMVIVEGVGGWMVPLSDTLMQADLVRALDIPVILVVGLRLGCLNHALLSARAIAADGCQLLGWIGNRIDPDMARIDENLATLRSRIAAPCLGVLEYRAEAPPQFHAATLAAAVTAICKKLA